MLSKSIGKNVTFCVESIPDSITGKESDDKIKFISLECKLNFKEESYRYSDEYLKEIQLDERLKKYMVNDSDLL